MAKIKNDLVGTCLAVRLLDRFPERGEAVARIDDVLFGVHRYDGQHPPILHRFDDEGSVTGPPLRVVAW